MATHVTEEEQIEAFKKWWSENWVTVILPLAVAVFLYVGWFWWQDQKETQAQLASDKYDALVELLNEAQSAEGGLGEEDRSKVLAQSEGLISDHKTTLYADMANLIIAGLYVESNEHDKAANHINQVVMHGANPGVSKLAQARLAKVYLAQGKADDALKLVSGNEDDAYASLYAEVRGDILLSKGEKAAANTAYKTAQEKLGPQGLARSGLLQTKISATAVAEQQEPADSLTFGSKAPEHSEQAKEAEVTVIEQAATEEVAPTIQIEAAQAEAAEGETE